MKTKLTKTQQLAEDKKKERHKNMKQDIEEVGKKYFLDRALRDGALAYTHTGYSNVILYSEADDYIIKYYGTMGNALLKTEARQATSSHIGFKPLSKRTICRIFDDYETVLKSRGLPLHLTS